jgi:hypothetical protein
MTALYQRLASWLDSTSGKVFSMLFLALVLASFYVLLQPQRQKSTWVAPYYSASANQSFGGPMLIDSAQLAKFDALDDVKLEDRFQFTASSNLRPHLYNEIGYTYLVQAAHFIFPFLGQQAAIKVFQCLIHFLLVGLILFSPQIDARVKLGVFLLFGLNPLVLKFVVFNFYYFWQCIPAFLLGSIMVGQHKQGFLLLPILLLPFSLLARVTPVGLAALSVYYAYKRIGWHMAVGIFIFTLSVYNMTHQSGTVRNPYHTMYVGLGAYSNPEGIKLSDNEGYKLYRSSTGQELNASIGGNIYKPEVMESYKAILKKKVNKIFQEHPGMFLRNAIANSLASCSVGYVVGLPDFANYIISLSGLLILIFLAVGGQYWAIIALVLFSGTFTWFYPPIPAYMFANYATLGFAIPLSINHIYSKFGKRKKLLNL